MPIRVGGSGGGGSSRNYIFKDGIWKKNNYTLFNATIDNNQLKLAATGTSSESVCGIVKINDLVAGEVVCFKIAKMYEINKSYSYIRVYPSNTWLAENPASNTLGTITLAHNNGTYTNEYTVTISSIAGESVYFNVYRYNTNQLDVWIKEIWTEKP